MPLPPPGSETIICDRTEAATRRRGRDRRAPRFPWWFGRCGALSACRESAFGDGAVSALGQRRHGDGSRGWFPEGFGFGERGSRFEDARGVSGTYPVRERLVRAVARAHRAAHGAPQGDAGHHPVHASIIGHRHDDGRGGARTRGWYGLARMRDPRDVESRDGSARASSAREEVRRGLAATRRDAHGRGMIFSRRSRGRRRRRSLEPVFARASRSAGILGLSHTPRARRPPPARREP